jgi:hypothetical protein
MFGGVLISNNANCEYKLQLDSFGLLNIAVQLFMFYSIWPLERK